MKKYLLPVMLVLLILFSGCSLTLNLDTAFLTPKPSTPVVTVQPSPTPTVTLTPVKATPVANVPTLAGCQMRTDWPTYVVVRGDTLSNIARRANTTVAILTQANCLPNANTIIVGQKLYVPGPVATPAPVTSTSTPLPDAVGVVNILPFVQGASGIAELDRGATVTLVWDGAPTDAAFVQFMLLNEQMEFSEMLAEDPFPADGASATWVVPDQLDGKIVAYAYRSSMNMYRYSHARVVISRPPLSELPQINYFRTNIIGGVHTLEWQTTNVPFVNIVWNQQDGTAGGYYERLSGTGSIAVPPLGPQYSPQALFILIAMDANGNEIRDPSFPDRVLQFSLPVPVTQGAVLTASPNAVAPGGTVTLRWNVTGVGPEEQFSISRSRATEAGYDLIKEHLPPSGELTMTLPVEYQNFVEFILHAHGSSPQADVYTSIIVPVLADNRSQ